MGGVSPSSEGGHAHLSWEPLPFPALNVYGLWCGQPITGAPITCYVALDTTSPRKVEGRMSLELQSFEWALKRVMAVFEESYLDEPAPKPLEHQSGACSFGDHDDCDWDLPGACVCECHFNELR